MPTAVCEKHGLRYDPQSQSGCLRCRQESGEAIGTAAPKSAPKRAVAAPEAEKPGGVLVPLAVAASIWLVAAAALYSVHQRIAAAYVFAEADQEAVDTEAAAAEAPGGTIPVNGTAAGQTDAVLDELRTLQNDEPVAQGTGAPPIVPSSEQLSPEPVVSDEEPSTEPVVIETESGTPPPRR